jgi:hypothetical protein
MASQSAQIAGILSSTRRRLAVQVTPD